MQSTSKEGTNKDDQISPYRGIQKMILSSVDYSCPIVLAVNIAPKSIDIQNTEEIVESKS